MEIVALVPARGGSKGIPRKNLASVAGKPLIAWSIECCARREIAHAGRRLDGRRRDCARPPAASEMLRRPAELAGDETPMLDVVRHALAELGRLDVIVLLQPTSPLRRAEHIDEAVELLLESGRRLRRQRCRACRTASIQARFSRSTEIAPSRSGHRPTRRQDKPQLYARNGPAVLALRRDRLGDDLYGDDSRVYVMDPESSIDIDTPFELKLADLLLAER